MAYGGDVNVYVEDKAGDLGASPSPVPWWLSPDVDIPAHSGTAFQGANTVQIRVHAHEEPILTEKIVAEVYAGNPSLVMAPGSNAVRIDPGNLLFRPIGVAGTEPIADEPGGTATFPWTPSSAATAPDGPGHRCLIVRAFPQSVAPPTSPFDVPNEQHEAQHNIEVLTTMKSMSKMSAGGAGTPGDPRKVDEDTGLWWEALTTIAAGRRRGVRYVVWAFDPSPDDGVLECVREQLRKSRIDGISADPPAYVTLGAPDARGEKLDPVELVRKRGFARQAGELFAPDRVVTAAAVELGPRKPTTLLLRFDHSNIPDRTAVVLHGAQFAEDGRPEGGMTIVALAPRRR